MWSSTSLIFLLYLCSVKCCRDESNHPVDWFVIYKLPIQKDHANPLIRNGTAYVYITSESNSIQWRLSNLSINNPSSIPGLTLAPLYTRDTLMHVLYNDEPPHNEFTSENELGHTKGVLLSDNTTGYWLIHSVPHYPPLSSYSYPAKATKYGQNFLCARLDLKNMNIVGKQLQYNQPNIYASEIKASVEQSLPDIVKTIDKQYVKTPPWYQQATLQTIQGHEFVSFAKSRAFGKDLYSDWVAVALGNDLNVESWLHGPGRLPSNCRRVFKVRNVEEIAISEAELKFESERDHSKWAVSTTKQKPWICVGDINRAEHQKRRGGGTLCMKNLEIWMQYNKTINKIESCN